jgi:hypothetical protein
MGVSGRAPRNVRSVYASSNAPDANTVRREGETDAVVPAPAGGTSEPSGDRRRGDGAITKRRRVGTENAIDDPEPTLGCARCRHSQKGCDRCKAKHAKWAARNGAAGDGIEPERAPSGADDDRDEERESQHGDADAAHDAVDVAVAVADAAVADAGVSRAVPAQLPDRPRMYGKGAYAPSSASCQGGIASSRGTHTVTWRCSSWTKLESTSMHPVGTRVVARWPLHETAQNSACRRVLSLQ